MMRQFIVMTVAVACLLAGYSGVRAEDALCASVEMEISQEVTLERQAFKFGRSKMYEMREAV